MRPTEIILAHQATDFDALGSMLAARRLYPGAQVVLHGGLNRNVREFVALHEGELELVEAARCDLSAVTRAIVVETASIDRLGELAEVVRRPGVETVLFDHHGGEPVEWAGRAVTSDDGALCTTMVVILGERGIEPTPAEATALALGIHEDTGSLTFASTTLRDVEALAFCARHGASQELIARFLHLPLGDEQRALLTTLVDAGETHDVAGARVLIAGARWPRYVDGISTLAGKIVELAECEALVMAVEMEGRVFVVGRSRTPALDIGAALAGLGGGGHPQAASAIVRGRPLDAVLRDALAALPAGAVQVPLARDVMSSPPWFVDDSTSIEDALDECRRRRTSGVQVARDGMLIGAAEREDLGRAIAHGLAHAPVRGVMSSHVDAVAAGASLAELQRALLHSGTGRVPVTEAGGPGPHPVDAVLGVVTRGDLRRALRERTAEPAVAGAGELGERLVALPGLEGLWDAVREVAEGFDGVYLVGGAVRDVLLGEPTFDVDIAVEGDGVAFARALASRLDGRVHVHEKFRTAVVLARGQRVDVATARTEHYERPAALPVVEHASIQRDLHRRDFTINAMAVDVSAEGFGRLVDPFGGAEDLAAQRLRVLHNLSFIEDPTRIFRAVKYENRYGFSMGARTRELARACVEMGLVGEVSGARVRDELVAILSEDRVAGAVRRLCELGLDAEVHPALDCGAPAAALIERIDAIRGRLAPDALVWQARMGAISRRIPGDELVELLERLRIRRRDARVIGEVAVVAPRLAAPLAAAPDRARVGELLDAHPVEVAVAVAAGDDERAADAAELYLEQLRAVRLDLDGTALRDELGLEESPLVGEILAELLRRRRNGGVESRAAQLAAARELAAEAVS